MIRIQDNLSNSQKHPRLITRLATSAGKPKRRIKTMMTASSLRPRLALPQLVVVLMCLCRLSRSRIPRLLRPSMLLLVHLKYLSHHTACTPTGPSRVLPAQVRHAHPALFNDTCLAPQSKYLEEQIWPTLLPALEKLQLAIRKAVPKDVRARYPDPSMRRVLRPVWPCDDSDDVC